jgi:chemotaxis protein CheD
MLLAAPGRRRKRRTEQTKTEHEEFGRETTMLELKGEVEPIDVYLHPGESYFAPNPAVIRTILGSCVSVAFWSARLGVGALTHSQLPRSPQKLGVDLSLAEGRRYVDFAILDIARRFDELGVPRADVQVKVFGGGDVLLISEAAAGKPTVGKLNCEVALEVLDAEGFLVKASSLRGTSGLKIRFDTRTGEVLLRRLG